MAVVLTPGLYIPGLTAIGGGALSALTTTLNAVGNYHAGGFAAPGAYTITQLGFRPGVITVNDYLDLQLETVDSNGHPTGTLVAAGATVRLTPGGSFQQMLGTLGTPYTLTPGEKFAAVCRVPSGSTFNGLIYTHMASGQPTNQPWHAYKTGGGGQITISRTPWLMIFCDDGAGGNKGEFFPGVWPNLNTQFSISTTTYNKIAVKWNKGFKSVLAGIWAHCSWAVGTDIEFAVYDDNGGVPGNELYSQSVAQYKPAAGVTEMSIPLTTDFTLEADTTYYVGIGHSATSTANFVQICTQRSTLPLGYGQYIADYMGRLSILYKHFSSLGSWFADDAQIPNMGVIIRSIETGAEISVPSQRAVFEDEVFVEAEYADNAGGD